MREALRELAFAVEDLTKLVRELNPGADAELERTYLHVHQAREAMLAAETAPSS